MLNCHGLMRTFFEEAQSFNVYMVVYISCSKDHQGRICTNSVYQGV